MKNHSLMIRLAAVLLGVTVAVAAFDVRRPDTLVNGPENEVSHCDWQGCFAFYDKKSGEYRPATKADLATPQFVFLVCHGAEAGGCDALQGLACPGPFVYCVKSAGAIPCQSYVTIGETPDSCGSFPVVATDDPAASIGHTFGGAGENDCLVDICLTLSMSNIVLPPGEEVEDMIVLKDDHLKSKAENLTMPIGTVPDGKSTINSVSVQPTADVPAGVGYDLKVNGNIVDSVDASGAAAGTDIVFPGAPYAVAPGDVVSICGTGTETSPGISGQANIV